MKTKRSKKPSPKSSSRSSSVSQKRNQKKNQKKKRSASKSSTSNRSERLRYAVVGQGSFAQTAILPAFSHAKRAELTALVSGDLAKLRKLGKDYKVKNLFTYDQYDDLLRSGLIDAVYIALPNWMHHEYAKRAADAGIHVLCEKPMAVTVDECDEMMRTADSKGVKFMVAYRLHFEQANLSTIDLIQSGKIGDPRYFVSSFSFPVKEDNIRAQSEQIGGGPVYDIGVYCINAARYLFQSEPIQVFAFSGENKKDALPKTYDTVSVQMLFPEGRLASFVLSFGSSATDYYEVVGTKGSICLEDSYTYHGVKTQSLMVKGKEKTKKFKITDQIAPELDYFADCVRSNRAPEPSAYEGFIDVMIVQAIQQSLMNGVPVPLSITPRKKRPTLDQEIERPGLRKKPELFHVEDPSKEEAA